MRLWRVHSLGDCLLRSFLACFWCRPDSLSHTAIDCNVDWLRFAKARPADLYVRKKSETLKVQAFTLDAKNDMAEQALVPAAAGRAREKAWIARTSKETSWQVRL